MTMFFRLKPLSPDFTERVIVRPWGELDPVGPPGVLVGHPVPSPGEAVAAIEHQLLKLAAIGLYLWNTPDYAETPRPVLLGPGPGSAGLFGLTVRHTEHVLPIPDPGDAWRERARRMGRVRLTLTLAPLPTAGMSPEDTARAVRQALTDGRTLTGTTRFNDLSHRTRRRE
ncbi:hypothetical protein [Streptomyces katsurahamanus]|uniref:Uncharacterized protein n=1 Tax=Streptomyces katsurahamanus TaxID=2577098 RepID=A0ABW9NQ32_9ACTN|nr:hypothetical protein [Streptomyces katsurahamanus]MQS35420.1 hypothetical protein [Streptomyces katsurahamanus]